MFQQEITLDQVLTYIHQADDLQVNEIIQAIVSRYREVYPDWDITFLSLPRNDPEERNHLIQYFLTSIK